MEAFISWDTGSDFDVSGTDPFNQPFFADFDETGDCNAPGGHNEIAGTTGPDGAYSFAVSLYTSCTQNVEFFDYEVYVDGQLVESGTGQAVEGETVSIDVSL